ncbi:hypothetical protein DERF_005766 [Dermatophagoides farinae]|uniref:ATP-dependent DNA helicase n=1 Tax=Dermatophagoides farinae TaxID=6954 RepID=A0A922I625_DERFA|nr:hypothetical protein DERF_005766 [Dermatophagoides farinae]
MSVNCGEAEPAIPTYFQYKHNYLFVQLRSRSRFQRNAFCVLKSEYCIVIVMSIHVINIIDLLLKDLMQSQEVFGGKLIIFGGDFRQIFLV